jgi:hypothetical protein
LGYYALTDLVGNKPNPKEIGRRFEGVRSSIIEKVPIAGLDPDKDILGDALDSIYRRGLLIRVPKDSLFNKDKPIAFLPALEGWSTKDSIPWYYPGSVGQLIRPYVDDQVNKIEERDTVDIPVDSITFHAKVYYHTNLGNFVVESKGVKIKCNDPIFRIDGDEKTDCRNNGATQIYLAWNLKDAKDRWVGAGAYVEVYDYHWEVNYKGLNKNGNPVEIRETIDKAQRKIEMMGVKRFKKAK